MYLVRPPFLMKRFYPEVLWRKQTDEKVIFLSFDDGPHPEITPWVLDLLKKEGIPAIFFCVGDNVRQYPEIYERILAEGHLTGNHTHNHLNGWKTDSGKYLRNIGRCATFVKSSFFRPPYGRMKVSAASRISRSYQIVMWDVISGDFDKHTAPEKCLDNTLRNTREGSIVVFHDSAKAWTNLKYALPRYLEKIRSRGYRFGSLAENDKPVKA